MLGAGAEGFMSGKKDEEEAQRQRDAAAFQKTQRTFTQGQQQRTLQEQAALEVAANKPVQLQASVAQPTSAPMAEAPQQAAPTGPMQSATAPVDGQGVQASPVGQLPIAPMQAAAAPKSQAAPAEQDMPEDALDRQAAAMMKFDPVRAASLRADSMKLRLGRMELADKQWDGDVETARTKGLQGLIDFTDKTHADGQGGAVKSKAIFSADGKTFTIAQVMPDGTMKPTDMPPLPNDQSGIDTLAMSLKKGIPTQARLTHYLQVQRENRQEKRDADLNANTIEHNKVLDRYYTGLIDARFDKNDVDANKPGKGSAFERMPEHDKALLGDFNKQLEAINSERLKARASGMWQPDSPGSKAIAKDEAGLLMQRDVLLKRYQGEAPAADPLSLRKPAAPAGGTKVSPMQQATNDSDRPTILAAEFQKTATPEDRAGLQREIDRLPADQRAKTKALIDGTAAPKTAAATVTKPSTAPGRMQAVAAKASADEIPSPPPETRQVGLSTKPNPDFIEWRAKYGVAYAKKQADDDAAGSLAASAAKRTYNPFAQNRVN